MLILVECNIIFRLRGRERENIVNYIDWVKGYELIEGK